MKSKITFHFGHSAWLFLILAGLCLSLAPGQGLDFGQYGEASFQVLKQHSSARILGLSGTCTGMDGSTLEATECNPATARRDSAVLLLTHGLLYKEFEGNISGITWGLPAYDLQFLLHARFLGFDDIPGYGENPFEPQASYGAHSYKIQTGVAGVYYGVHWGVTTSYVENSISFSSYRSWIADVGLLYSPLKNLWIGGAVNHGDLLTSSLEFSEGKPMVPTIGRLGVSYRQDFAKDYFVTALADARTRNDEKLTFPLGLEFGWRDILILRGGFPLMEPEPSPSFGVGLHWARFRLDYAMQRHQTLSPGHYGTLSVHY